MVQGAGLKICPWCAGCQLMVLRYMKKGTNWAVLIVNCSNDLFHDRNPLLVWSETSLVWPCRSVDRSNYLFHDRNPLLVWSKTSQWAGLFVSQFISQLVNELTCWSVCRNSLKRAESLVREVNAPIRELIRQRNLSLILSNIADFRLEFSTHMDISFSYKEWIFGLLTNKQCEYSRFCLWLYP